MEPCGIGKVKRKRTLKRTEFNLNLYISKHVKYSEGGQKTLEKNRPEFRENGIFGVSKLHTSYHFAQPMLPTNTLHTLRLKS